MTRNSGKNAIEIKGSNAKSSPESVRTICFIIIGIHIAVLVWHLIYWL
jgi:hypothetical protein